MRINLTWIKLSAIHFFTYIDRIHGARSRLHCVYEEWYVKHWRVNSRLLCYVEGLKIRKLIIFHKPDNVNKLPHLSLKIIFHHWIYFTSSHFTLYFIIVILTVSLSRALLLLLCLIFSLLRYNLKLILCLTKTQTTTLAN